MKVSNGFRLYVCSHLILLTVCNQSIIMESNMSFESVCNVLMSRKTEIIKCFLVRVDTVPEMLTGLRVAGIMSDQVALDIKSKILEDVTGVNFAEAAFQWMLNYLHSSASMDNKLFVSKILTSYAAMSKYHMRLHTTYGDRDIDYSILGLI